jgi:hypothetical protein
MKSGWKMLIRASTILIYLIFFFGTYLVLHVYLASPATIQDQRVYSEENAPEYFPILVVHSKPDGSEPLALLSLEQAEYAGQTTTTEQSWRLYQQEGEGQLLQTSGVSYNVTPLAPKRLQVEISISEANAQRTSAYTYEIEAGRAYPRSYRLLSSFGHNFSPIPFMMIITGILIYLSEKFLLPRILKSSS